MGNLLNIGFGNSVNTDKLIAVVSSDGAPIKRLIQQARDNSKLVDATCGRKTKSVLYMSDDVIVLSFLMPETIAKRLGTNFDMSSDEGIK